MSPRAKPQVARHCSVLTNKGPIRYTRHTARQEGGGGGQFAEGHGGVALPVLMPHHGALHGLVNEKIGGISGYVPHQRAGIPHIKQGEWPGAPEGKGNERQ